MECIRPIKAGFDSDYNLTFSSKKLNKELSTFEFPCRKCLACRLNISREKAVRAIHEASLFENNIFLTLTYDNEHVGDGKLHYIHFQLFMKSLREYVTRNITDPELKSELAISYMVTGEYGDKNKRPHWHAIIFNYRPTDSKHDRTTERGELVFTSEKLTDLWGRGKVEFGSVTMDSASYVARYAAKKLGHGQDHEHDYHPIHKTSSKHAIGKRWIQKYYKTDCFNLGFIRLPNGEKTSIPRYYTDWLKENDIDYFIKYANGPHAEAIKNAQQKTHDDHLEYLKQCELATGGLAKTKSQVKMTILKQKFKQLQERLKL